MKADKLISEAYNQEITIIFVGAGGTGSLLLHKLASIAVSLQEIRNITLKVIVMDEDMVSSSNIGRQLYTAYDVNRSKVAVLVERINRFYGLGWNACAFNYPMKADDFLVRNIIITCVDTPQARLKIEKYLQDYRKRKTLPSDHGHRFAYWLDCGNNFSTGNVVLTDLDKLPSISSYLTNVKPGRKRATCSLAMALGKQHLMVNTWAATIAGTMLCDMIFDHIVDVHAAFYNIRTFQIRTIQTKDYATKQDTVDAL